MSKAKVSFWALESVGPKLNSWETPPHVQIARHVFAAAFIGSTLHVVGGSFQSDGMPGILSPTLRGLRGGLKAADGLPCVDLVEGLQGILSRPRRGANALGSQGGSLNPGLQFSALITGCSFSTVRRPCR